MGSLQLMSISCWSLEYSVLHRRSDANTNMSLISQVFHNEDPQLLTPPVLLQCKNY